MHVCLGVLMCRLPFVLRSKLPLPTFGPEAKGDQAQALGWTLQLWQVSETIVPGQSFSLDLKFVCFVVSFQHH